MKYIKFKDMLSVNYVYFFGLNINAPIAAAAATPIASEEGLLKISFTFEAIPFPLVISYAIILEAIG